MKKILVCSAWPYGYSMPHLGNLMSSLLSGDVFARYYKMKGFDTLYVSGTDVHGTRAEFEAAKKGIDVKSLLEKNHNYLKKLIENFNIEFDNYTHTESENHKDFVEEIYMEMEKNGNIITKEEERAFCKDCNVFLADAFIEGVCPKCEYAYAKGNQCEKCGTLLEAEELKEPKCKICNHSNIIFKETKHWFLDLKKLQPNIEKFVDSRKEGWSKNVVNMTKNFLNEGLKPRAITRDLKWGIHAPFMGAEDKIIYVWGEAALGYVSATKEYFMDKEKPERWKEFWMGDNVKQIYTMAKDNIPFHTIFFPAQLIASEKGYHLPDIISATEYLNWIENEKFSKSRNVGIFMDDALEILPAPYWRFYLLYDRPESRDTSFSWKELNKTINMVLIGDLCNFVNRTLQFLDKNYILKVPNAELDEADRALIDKIHITESVVSEILDAGNVKDAIDMIINLCREANTYFQQREPWKNVEKRDATIYTSMQLVKALAVFMRPFTPSISEKLWETLNIDRELVWSELKVGMEAGHEIKKPEILIDSIDIEEVKKKYDSLKKEN